MIQRVIISFSPLTSEWYARRNLTLTPISLLLSLILSRQRLQLCPLPASGFALLIEQPVALIGPPAGSLPPNHCPLVFFFFKSAGVQMDPNVSDDAWLPDNDAPSVQLRPRCAWPSIQWRCEAHILGADEATPCSPADTDPPQPPHRCVVTSCCKAWQGGWQ